MKRELHESMHSGGNEIITIEVKVEEATERLISIWASI